MSINHRVEIASYPSDIRAALAILANTDLPSYNYAPPLHRLLWRAGVVVAPPHLASVASNAFLFAPWFCAAWGIFTWCAFFSSSGVPAAFFAMMAIFIGGAFGFATAIWYRESARKRGLPAWRDIKSIASYPVLDNSQDDMKMENEARISA